MKKQILFLLCVALSVGAASEVVASKSQTVQYEIKLKSGAFGDMGTRKMWIKGDNFRWEYMSAGLPLKLVKNSKGIFLIHPWNKIVGKYPSLSNRGDPIALFPGPAGPIDSFLKKVKAVKRGTEKINGELCDVYTYAAPADRRNCRIWISKKTSKPVKLTMEGVRGKADPIIATYSKFVIGANVPDSLFEIPSGYQVKPMPNSNRAFSGEPATTVKNRKEPA